MWQKPFAASALLILGFSGTGLAAPEAPARERPSLALAHVYGVDDSRIVEEENQLFVIRIPSNPSTGYETELSSLDADNVALVSREFVSRCSGGRVGCGGFELFTFRVLKKGTSLIRISQGRSWEPESQDVHDFSVVAPFDIFSPRIAVTKGELFTVEMGQNASTGYLVSLVEPVASSLKLRDTFSVSHCPEGMVGCGNRLYYTFEAVGEGASLLEFLNARPWDPEDGERFGFQVSVSSR